MFSDPASQNKILKGPGQVSVGKAIIIGRFLVDCVILWGLFGDDQDMFWTGPWHVLIMKNNILKLKSVFENLEFCEIFQ